MGQIGTAADLDRDLGSLLRPGMTILDVGAGVGERALAIAAKVGPRGRVLAVEPNPARAETLRRNAIGAPGAPIRIVRTAALWKWGPHNLDRALRRRVDALLIDVDAAPHVSLFGARRLLDRQRPLVLLALWPQRLREAGVDPVTALGDYRALGLTPVGVGEELPADPGKLVLAVEAAAAPYTLLRLERIDPPPPRRERLLPRSRRLGRAWQRRFPPPPPRTLAYDASHRALVASLLDDERWRARFAADRQLPVGLGYGFDERAVEYPWLFSRRLSGRVLDAGSVLNHRHVAERLLPSSEELTIVTLAPEPVAFTELGISYLYADLRDLPLRDGRFDEVVCLSTLEHVGMDNSGYGATAPRAEDPQAEALRALRELLRVARPGGRIHLSLPFGRSEDHGWLRQLDRGEVDELLRDAGVVRREEAVFAHTAEGWRRVAPERAAEAAYNPGPQRGEDGAVAARAVWCATIHV